MKNDRQPLNEKSRSKLRSSRRKTNIILNSLIALVLLLIIVVSSKIFFGDNKKDNEEISLVTTANGLVERDSETGSDKKSDVNKDNKKESQDKELASDDKEVEDTSDEDNVQNDQEDAESPEIVTEGGSDPSVKKTIINPEWKPVGTSQEGQHVNTFKGADWDEMVQAVTYGIGIEESNMIIEHLGNNGPNKAVGTIIQKDTRQKHRIYIEWVDEQGWKPALVEELK